MEYRVREYPMFSACGLNCGLCPRHQMEGKSKCPGCAGKDFLSTHPKCGVLSCSQRKDIEYCYQCDEFPCKKYDGADKSDSFITHLHQLKDMQKAKTLGIDIYKLELDKKIAILENLLVNYNDGKRKSFFCIAVNLLELHDIKAIMEQVESTDMKDMSQKEKAAYVVSLFQNKADEQQIAMKLRKNLSGCN